MDEDGRMSSPQSVAGPLSPESMDPGGVSLSASSRAMKVHYTAFVVLKEGDEQDSEQEDQSSGLLNIKRLGMTPVMQRRLRCASKLPDMSVAYVLNTMKVEAAFIAGLLKEFSGLMKPPPGRNPGKSPPLKIFEEGDEFRDAPVLPSRFIVDLKMVSSTQMH